MITAKMLGIFAAAFLAGSFVASPELRAFAANTVFSTDIVDGEVKTADIGNNAVTAAKIKDNEVKAAEIATAAVGANEIATDAVGGSELQGVSKILFGVCGTSEFQGSSWTAGAVNDATCAINGADTDDSVIAVLNGDDINHCYGTRLAWVESANTVKVNIGSDCLNLIQFDTASTIAVIVYDK